MNKSNLTTIIAVCIAILFLMCSCTKKKAQDTNVLQNTADVNISDTTVSDAVYDYSILTTEDRILQFDNVKVKDVEDYVPQNYEMSQDAAANHLNENFSDFCSEILGTPCTLSGDTDCAVWESNGIRMFVTTIKAVIDRKECIADIRFDAQTGKIYFLEIHCDAPEDLFVNDMSTCLKKYAVYLDVKVNGRKYECVTENVKCKAQYNSDYNVSVECFTIKGTSLCISIGQGNLPSRSFLMPGSADICVMQANKSQISDARYDKKSAENALQSELKSLYNSGLVTDEILTAKYEYCGLYMAEFTDDENIKMHHVFVCEKNGISIHTDDASGKIVYVRAKIANKNDADSICKRYAEYLDVPITKYYRSYSDTSFCALYRKADKGRYVAYASSDDELVLYLSSRNLDR